MSREDFEEIKLHAKAVHDERVAKNPDRIAYAIQQFDSHGIEYALKTNRQGIFIAVESLTISCSNFTLELERFKAKRTGVEFMR